MSKQDAKSAKSLGGSGKVRKSRKPLPVQRASGSGKFVGPTGLRTTAVMRAAEASGLLAGKSKRIGGRISPALLEQAKKHTGIEGDTDLIEFALANLAIEDDFAKTFRKVQGTVDRDLKLGFDSD